MELIKKGYKYFVENHSEELKKLYLEDYRTIKEISEIYSSQPHTINRALKNMNVTMRTKAETNKLKKLDKLENMIGHKFNRLLVIAKSEESYRHIIVNCDCGINGIQVDGYSVFDNETKSCGCLNLEKIIERNKNNATHGLSGTKLYDIYKTMISRCSNVNNKVYKYYGGRGIRVCDEWLGEEGIKSFHQWSYENGYQEGLSIDRINNDGDYEPNNCQWITRSENVAKRNVEYFKNKKLKGGN